MRVTSVFVGDVCVYLLQAGQFQISFQVDGVLAQGTQSVALDWTAGPVSASNSSFTCAYSTVIAGESFNCTLVARDGYGNVVSVPSAVTSFTPGWDGEPPTAGDGAFQLQAQPLLQAFTVSFIFKAATTRFFFGKVCIRNSKSKVLRDVSLR